MPQCVITVLPPKYAFAAMITAGIRHTSPFHVEAVFNLVNGGFLVTGVRVYTHPDRRAADLAASWRVIGNSAEKVRVSRGKITEEARLKAFLELEAVAEEIVSTAIFMVPA